LTKAKKKPEKIHPKRQLMHDLADTQELELILFDGFDDAILGIGQRYTQKPGIVYSRKKMIEILMKDMSWEEAVEYLSFNTECCWCGEETPIILDDTVMDEL
jgi:hypothetical protein